MTAPEEGWQVWSDAKAPLLENTTEEDAKEFVENQTRRSDLYIQSPEGEELIYEGGKWVPV